MDQSSDSSALGVDELEAVFKFIPSDQLLELRQVSKESNEAALPVLRKREDLNFILTDDHQRNRNFLKFLQNLPENGFVASGMKLKLQVKFPAVFAPQTSSPFQDVLFAICSLLGTKRTVKKFIFEVPDDGWILTSITSENLLRMISHLSPSLEILDMEESGTCIEFYLSPEAHDEMLELVRNSPFNNLKRIVPPSHSRLISMTLADRYNYFDEWLSIVIQAAPKLLEDPTAECRKINEELKLQMDVEVDYEDEDTTDEDDENMSTGDESDAD